MLPRILRDRPLEFGSETAVWMDEERYCVSPTDSTALVWRKIQGMTSREVLGMLACNTHTHIIDLVGCIPNRHVTPPDLPQGVLWGP